MEHIKTKQLYPFVKWAGGKRQELEHILPCIPNEFNRYIEPFVGGGAVYFSINKNSMFINDKSYELINLYKMIQEDNEEFYFRLKEICNDWENIKEFVKKELDFLTMKCFYFIENEIKKKEINDFVNKLDLSFLNNVNMNIFIEFFKENFNRRIKKIKTMKDTFNPKDIPDNIETILKSSYYMSLRYLYNNIEKFDMGLSFHIAIFYFIREFCYSGMFRYNKDGKFNVPYGGISYNNKNFAKKIDYIESIDLKEHLKKTEIYNLDFEDFLNVVNLNADDFIFLDPPYDTIFSSYSNMAFIEKDQRRLANYLYNMKAKFMLIIKNTELIEELYFNKGFNISEFDKKYLVNFKNRNNKNSEHLIITNYQ